MVMAGAELEWDSHRWSVRRRLVVVVGKDSRRVATVEIRTLDLRCRERGGAEIFWMELYSTSTTFIGCFPFFALRKAENENIQLYFICLWPFNARHIPTV